ncbi:hypothetical protein GCM10023187_18120 [Nibrella viscosa]|uniref:histidine kinase n=1 Tax=Nibrella viscosa TaxID=1084524 RepID=A0ABP8K9S9_9BACT
MYRSGIRWSGDPTVSDITANQLSLQRIEQTNLNLRLSNNNLQQIAYVASHDLQEPLRKIQQFGDLLQAEFAPLIGENGADMIRRIAQLRQLFKNLLSNALKLLQAGYITATSRPGQDATFFVCLPA